MADQNEITWINSLNKKELMQECEKQGLKTDGTADVLRKRLAEHYKMQKLNAAEPAKDTSLGTPQNKHIEIIQNVEGDATTTEAENVIQAVVTSLNNVAISTTENSLTSSAQQVNLPVTTIYTSCITSPVFTSSPLQLPTVSTGISSYPRGTYVTSTMPSSSFVTEQLPLFPQIPFYNYIPDEKCFREEKRMTDADIVDKVRKWGVKFDQGHDPLGFVERVEELAECYQIPLDNLVRVLPELLTRDALIWYRNNRQNWKTWVEFIEDFRAFYLPTRFQEKLSDDIRARMQRTNENVRNYVTAIQAMQRWQEGVTSQQKLDRIYQNLLPEYRLFIRQKDYANLNELIKICEEYERIKIDEKQYLQKQEKKITRQPTTQQRPAYPVQASNSSSSCWSCGKTGHFRRDCRNPPLISCNRCGKRGIMTKDCNCARNSGNEDRMVNPRDNPPFQN